MLRKISLLILLGSILSLFPQNPVMAQEIGLQLYSLRKQFAKDVPGTLALVKKFGIKEVELDGSYGLDPVAYKKMVEGQGLKIISMGSDFATLETDPQSVADKAKTFGAKFVMLAWVPHKGDDFTIEDVKKMVTVFNNAGKVLKQNGVSFCYHPHGYEFRPYEDGTLFDYLIKNTDPQYVNYEMDVFWVKHPGQDPVALLNKYPNRFLMMHLKDRQHGTPGNQNGHADVETNVVLGAGDVGIAEIMRAARKIGVKHYFIEDESSRVVEQIPQSLKFLKGIK